MAEVTAKGTWVEISGVILAPSERAPQVPEDTKLVPLEMRTKGFLVEPGLVGKPVEIVTTAGRRLRGILAAINPAYDHGFGAPLPELTTIGTELRDILRKRGFIR